MANRLVIDTNVFVSALSSKSIYHLLIQKLLNEEFQLFVTDEIMLEYEEMLKVKYSYQVANAFIASLKELPNVEYVKVYFKWNLLTDEDDNKFTDCYLAANAQLLITNDKGFEQLKKVNFPIINIMKLEDYLKM
jgi:putative PIN family toxin of toxin-antitoxin system